MGEIFPLFSSLAEKYVGDRIISYESLACHWSIQGRTYVLKLNISRQNVIPDPRPPSKQCRKLVCNFLQAMLSECPPLMHLLLRQTLPTEALVLLLDGVRVFLSGPSMELFRSGEPLISDVRSPTLDSRFAISDFGSPMCDLRYSISEL